MELFLRYLDKERTQVAVQFERNVNLEEIDSDALFGIQYLSNQTLFQKVILWGNVIVGAGTFIVTQMVYNAPFLVSFFLSLVFVGTGFLFGANQNEHMTVGEYLKLMFFKPVKYVNFMSSEDMYVMKDEAEKLKAEAEVEERRKIAATPESQRRSLILIIVLMAAFLIFACTLFGLSSYKKSHMTHHIVTYNMGQEIVG